MNDGSELKLLIKTLTFAAHKHKDQRRKDMDASPYINHPIALADILVNQGGITDIATICAALLHHTVEDTKTTKEELSATFGKEISDIVIEVTDNKYDSKEDRKRAQIEHASYLSSKAKAVKLADKTSNLRDMVASPPKDWSSERRQAYFEWAKEVVDGLRGDWTTLEAVFDDQYNKRLRNS